MAIVLVLSIIFIIASIAEIETLIQTLQHGNWLFLILAVFIEGLWLVNLTAQYHSIYRAVGIEVETIKGLFPIILSANFVNIIAPSAGMSGITVILTRARNMKYSTARATVASTLFIETDYLGFICVLAVGMIVLIRRNNISASEITGAAILVLAASVFAFLLYLGMRSEQALGKALIKLTRMVNFVLRPLIHRDYLKEAHTLDFAHELVDGLNQMKSNPKSMIMPILFALINKALLLAIFTLVFLAFSVPVSIGTIIAGFSIGYLFMIVSPTPAGIGIVEGSLTLALTSMYVPIGLAAIITLAYRGITFWLPLAAGMVSLRWLDSKKLPQETVSSQQSEKFAPGSQPDSTVDNRESPSTEVNNP
jgi:glycosyltransferase 2 family protein